MLRTTKWPFRNLRENISCPSHEQSGRREQWVIKQTLEHSRKHHISRQNRNLPVTPTPRSALGDRISLMIMERFILLKDGEINRLSSNFHGVFFIIREKNARHELKSSLLIVVAVEKESKLTGTVARVSQSLWISTNFQSLGENH